MHSIKNTIVAVGLLGLSFLFYQASSNNNDDAGEMVPPLEISYGNETESQAQNPIQELNDAGGSIKQIEMPKIDRPNFPAPNFTQLNVNTLSGGTNAKPSPSTTFQPVAGQKSNDFSIGTPSRPPAKAPSDANGSGFQPNDFGSNQFVAAAPPTNRQPISNVARDEQLIEALDQNTISLPSGNSAPKTSPIEGDNDSAYASQNSTPSTTPPAHSSAFNLGGGNSFGQSKTTESDSSYNQLVTNVSSQPNPNPNPVVRAGTEPASTRPSLKSAWPQVEFMAEQGKLKDALKLLTQHYHSEDVSGPQRKRMIAWLDALAAKVIFSEEHHLNTMPYTVANESLVDISDRWKVPAQLIYNINRQAISNPAMVAPGTQLKMVEGPFHAEIDTEQNVMTLFLGDLYAGRFPIRVGISGMPQLGEYRVLAKSAEGHDWFDADKNKYPPSSPENGYGPNWIGLSKSLCIHAIDNSATNGHSGCIGLTAQDSKDVFAILSDGSNVKIIR
jgi:lipoprotein-anchoring transpeptidase ErfK/SrfK